MSHSEEKKEKQEEFGFKKLGPKVQNLILEQVQKKYQGIPLYNLPVEEMRRLRDEEFKGKTYSHAIFPDPEKALKHIRGALTDEINLRTPNPKELISHMGQLIRGMDADDAQNNLELLSRLYKKK